MDTDTKNMKTHLQQTLIGLLLAAFAVTSIGCKTMPTVAEIATPARIEAVVALGAYHAGSAAIEKGGRATLTKTRDALNVIWESKVADLPAVIAALQAAGITVLDTEDGTLSVGAVLVFADLWDGSAGKILSGERVRAVIAGCIRGFDVALAAKPTRGISPVNIAVSDLMDDVIATRSPRAAP